MTRRRCAYQWPGDLFGCLPHTCARPPGHHDHVGHMCFCGDRP